MQNIINRALSTHSSDATSPIKNTLSLREFYTKKREQQQVKASLKAQTVPQSAGKCSPSSISTASETDESSTGLKENTTANNGRPSSRFNSSSSRKMFATTVPTSPAAAFSWGGKSTSIEHKSLDLTNSLVETSYSDVDISVSVLQGLAIDSSVPVNRPSCSEKDSKAQTPVKYINPIEDDSSKAPDLKEISPPAYPSWKPKKTKKKMKSKSKKGMESSKDGSLPFPLSACTPFVELTVDNPPPGHLKQGGRGRSRTRRQSGECSDDSSVDSCGRFNMEDGDFSIEDDDFEEDNSVAGDVAAFFWGICSPLNTEEPQSFTKSSSRGFVKSSPNTFIKSSSVTAMKGVKFLSEQSSKLHRNVSESLSKENIDGYMGLVENSLKMTNSTKVKLSTSYDYDTSYDESYLESVLESTRDESTIVAQDLTMSTIEPDTMGDSFEADSGMNLDDTIETEVTFPVNNIRAVDSSFDVPKAQLVAVLQGRVRCEVTAITETDLINAKASF